MSRSEAGPLRLVFLIVTVATLGWAAVPPVTNYSDAPPQATYWVVFWHHSTGEAWLDYGLRDGYSAGYSSGTDVGNGLRNVTYGGSTRCYLLVDHGYGNQNDYTDYVDWYPRFRREVGDASGNVWGTSTPIAMSDRMFTCYNYTLTEHNPDGFGAPNALDIILFKPCFPNSWIGSYDTSYDGNTGVNNGRGIVTGGTPYSDSAHSHTNLNWLNPANPADNYDAAAWSDHGDWANELAQIKVAYRGLLNIAHDHPNKLFVAILAPRDLTLGAEERENCRKLSYWFRTGWLHEYDPTGTDTFQDYAASGGSINVAYFDYFNAMVYTGDIAPFDDDYGWGPDDFNDYDSPQRLPGTDPGDVANTAKTSDYIGRGRCGLTDGDSHPTEGEDLHATDIFVGNNGYRSWINMAVNRWKSSPTASVKYWLLY